MMKPRQQLTISYRILDASGHTVEVIKETGTNKHYLLWKVERLVRKKYGKDFSVHQLKVIETP